jgi:hypothetical protein
MDVVGSRRDGNTLDLLALGTLSGVLFGLRLGFSLNLGLVIRDFLFGAIQVDHFERDLFPLAPLGAVEADTIGKHLIFVGELVGAVFEVQPFRRTKDGSGKRQDECGNSKHFTSIMEDDMPNRTEPRTVGQWIRYVVVAAIAIWLVIWMLRISGINLL